MNSLKIANPCLTRARACRRRVASVFLAAILMTGAFGLLTPSSSAKSNSEMPVADDKVAELAKRPTADLIKMLQIGSARQKSQAAQAIGAKAYNGESVQQAIPLLIQMLRPLTGGKVAEDAAAALALIGTPALGYLKDEVSGSARQTTQSSRLLAARALGFMGAPAKQTAAPELTAILENPKRSSSVKDPLAAEAALALASMGGPYKPALLPDIVGAMNACTDPDRRLLIALRIAVSDNAAKRYSEELVRVLGKAATTQGLELTQRQEVLNALVSLDTPSSLQMVLLALSPPQMNFTYSERAVAAVALANVKNPSAHVLDGIIKALQTERSNSVIYPICRALAAFGAEARPILPNLRTYLKDLPQKTNLDGGDRERPGTERAVKAAIAKIEDPDSSSPLSPAVMTTSSGSGTRAINSAAAELKRLDLNGQIKFVLNALTNVNVTTLTASGIESVLIRGLETPSCLTLHGSDILRGLVRIDTPTSVKAVCDVLVSPNTYRDHRIRDAAAQALAACRRPSAEVIGALEEAVSTETSACVLTTTLRTLRSFGAASATTLPTLEQCLRDLPANDRIDSQREKAGLADALKDTLAGIKKASSDSALSNRQWSRREPY